MSFDAPPKTSIVRNFLYSSLTTTLNVVVPLLTYPYVARVLGPENMGRLGVPAAFASYFSVAAAMGIPVYGVRLIAAVRGDREKLNKAASELFFLSAAAGLLATIGFAIGVALVPRFAADPVLFAVYGAGIFLGSLSVDWLFQGIEEFRFIGLRNTVLKLVFVAALFLVVRERSQALRYALLFTGMGVVGGAVNIATALRYAKPRLRGLEPLRHLAPMATLAIVSFMITAYTNLDFTLLGALSNPRQAGLYSLSIRLARAAVIVGATLSGVLLPRLSALSGRDEAEFGRILKASSGAVLFFSLPAMAGIAATAADLARIFGGSEFLESATSLRILSLIVPIVCVSNLLQLQILIPRGKERAMLISFVSGLAATALSLAILIPRLGHVGAAIGMLLGELTVLVVHALICGKAQLMALADRRRLAIYGIGAALVLIVASVPVYLMQPGTARLGISVLSGVGVYAAFVLVSKDGLALDLARRIFRRPRKASS